MSEDTDIVNIPKRNEFYSDYIPGCDTEEYLVKKTCEVRDLYNFFDTLDFSNNGSYKKYYEKLFEIVCPENVWINYEVMNKLRVKGLKVLGIALTPEIKQKDNELYFRGIDVLNLALEECENEDVFNAAIKALKNMENIEDRYQEVNE